MSPMRWWTGSLQAGAAPHCGSRVVCDCWPGSCAWFHAPSGAGCHANPTVITGHRPPVESDVMSEPITVHTSGAAARKESLASPRFAVVDGDPQADVATSTNPRGPRESITVVGIGEDGFDELGHKAQTALLRADV